ncbi:hypothetical protein DSCA_09260 [Desulfosarcina alkanivorans]|uniref:Uncharacterized protein n=1 Tax=Desulfosarcina alkanivorans TaxID=571177 RepID=A0A5K7YDE8_9BACT|nr:hypothetical protein [Desulfosarcina alkanivorans]BBO66996.1 hypothetical protein DSCA_09260 [Desulfosarcina alkanivorans]
MADSKNQSSPILVILCALGVFAFLLMVIYPNHRSIKEYDRRIALLNEEIALRQTLAPVYGQLIERVRLAPSTRLKTPKKKTLDIKNGGRLTSLFQRVALTAGVVLEGVIPDARAYERGDGRLTVDVIFRGPFAPLQTLINTIVEQPFVERIQRIQVKNSDDGKWIKLSVSLLHNSAHTDSQ